MKQAARTGPISILTDHSWKMIAGLLVGIQLALFAISQVVDRVWFPDTSQGFFAAMLLFAVIVGLDALTVGFGLKRAIMWAAIVTIGWIFGAIPYARRRQHLQRTLTP